MRELLVIIFALLLAGCSIKPELSQPISKFRIEPKEALHVKVEKSQKTLKISAPYGLRSIKSTDILYTKGDGKYIAYRDSKWEETPSRQLTRLLTNSLESVKIFKNVIVSPSKIRYDYLLETNVQAFEHVIENGNSYIRLRLNLFLVEALKKRVVGSYEFTCKEPTPSVDAKGVNEAFGVAMSKLNEENIKWLKELQNAKLF